MNKPCRRTASIASGASSLSPVVQLCLLLAVPCATGAADAKNEDLLNRAQLAQLKGETAAAVSLATQAIEADPRNPQSYYVRGRLYATGREPAKAVADFDQAIKLEPRGVEIYQLRGLEQFKLEHFPESVADFDTVIRSSPRQAPYHWQRGIACYYAGRFEEGRKQFELHQTVNSNDVENAVWHFLCVARLEGFEKARASLIKIKEDRRVPMMTLHALFAGTGKPADVLNAARSGFSTSAQLEQQLFYAHLYLGLYYDVLGDEKNARDYAVKAAANYRDYEYMGEVARVQADVLRKAEQGKTGSAGK